MRGFHKRLIEEERQLGFKCDALNLFIESDGVFHTLTNFEKQKLIEQRFVMFEYLTILRERIDFYNNEMLEEVSSE